MYQISGQMVAVANSISNALQEAYACMACSFYSWFLPLLVEMEIIW